LHHSRRSRRRNWRGAAPFPRQYFGSDNSRARPRAAASRQERPQGRDLDHHRRPAHAGRFRQGAGAWRRRGGDRQFGDPGNRLPRHARLPHQQLPGRHRDAAAASDGAAQGGRIVEAAGAVPGDVGRADEDPGARVRPHPSQRALPRRPGDLEGRDGAAVRRAVRRRRPRSVMSKAVRIHQNGGPDVLRYEDHEVAPPGPGEARVRQTAIGINFSDINVRRGGFYLARPPQFPLIIGNEPAGVVESVGPGVADVAPGDRVAYAGMTAEFFEKTGAYVEERNVPAERLIRLPAGLTEQQAAGMMVKGFTASLIINHVWRPKPGDTVLIHAAASGVGLILTQWAKHL